jgi:hypothetical protein
MMERDADFDTAILEGEDVGHVRPRAQHRLPIRPHVDQQLEMRQRKRPERGTRILREDDDFARALARRGRNLQHGRIVRPGRKRRKEIVEHRDIPGAFGNFGRMIRIASRRERVVLGGGQEGAVLAMPRVGDPLAAQRMPAQVRVWRTRRAARTGRGQIAGQRRARVQRELPAVRLLQAPAVHYDASPRSALLSICSRPSVRAAAGPAVAARIRAMGIFGVRSAVSNPFASW